MEQSLYGKVWIAGAGPGDAGLLTLRTAELIEEADVIVYDALLSAEILSRIPRETETIYVGKHAGNHPVPQEEINQILVREAKKGKRVLRLKGGDPFVFGRGGEEIEILRNEKISFEIIPGITSSVAVPAYAGIPVTHREYTSSFHVITGHTRRDVKPDIDYEALVKLNATLIFLMGVSAMETILTELIKAGMPEDMPAAVIERGTTARQRQVCATVKTLKQQADEAKIKAPAIIVVGKVCSLSEEFHWIKDRILGGKQFLVTRPRQNSSALAKRLRNLGAQVIEMPSIHTVAIDPNERLKKALGEIQHSEKEEWFVFTSPIGVHVFFEQLEKEAWDMRRLLAGKAQIKIAAIGSATAAALKEHGLFADIVPKIYNAGELGKTLAENISEYSAVSIFRAEEGSLELLPPLMETGVPVNDIALYRTEYEVSSLLRHKIEKMFQKEEIDAVTFTSASTVKGFVKAIKNVELQNVSAVCIGEQTAAEARKYGMKIQVAKRADMDAMTEKIVECFGNVNF